MLLPLPKNTKTITDLREDALNILNQIDEQKLFYIFYRSKPKAVLIDINEFSNIQELLEDYLDTKKAELLKKEPRGKGIPLSKIKQDHV